jgi:hypothetical protein
MSMERTNANEHRRGTDHGRTEAGEVAHGSRKGRSVKLVPLAPPGRITRKARDFEADIVQLRAQGYTLDAIRQALNAAGVHVSISTVRREALRSTAAVPVPSADGPQRQTLAPPVSTHARSAVELDAASAGASVPADWRSGKDVAQAYTSSVITNQFVRAKEKR